MGPFTNDRRPGLKPPRFTLRSAFWFFTLVSVLLAISNAAGPFTALVLSFFVLLALAHILGNLLGAQLRDNNDPRAHENRVLNHPPPTARPAFAPSTHLARRRSFRRLLLTSAALGAGVGSSIGGSWLARLFWEQSTLASLAVGALAFGVLGGFATAITSSFGYVAFGAVRQALREPPR